MEDVAVKPQGKGLAIGGFVLSLVGLIFTGIIMAAVAVSLSTGGGKGLGYFWIVLCLASVILSVMGMMKLGKTGGKRGLAIAGLIIGIVAVVWSIFGLMAADAAATMINTDLNDLNNALDNLKDLQ